jgi:hypothetical protein
VKGLIVKQPWLDLILGGLKPWEIRGSDTKIRGRICLIESGSGEIKGTAELTDSFRLNYADYMANADNHRINGNELYFTYNMPHVWAMKEPVKLDKPIPYKHPQGAVVWVNLPDDILAQP